jgi:hypothetical protein
MESGGGGGIYRGRLPMGSDKAPRASFYEDIIKFISLSRSSFPAEFLMGVVVLC